jgi:hypothetical protein
MVSTGSNDMFRNKLNFWFIRAAVALVIVPVIVVALKSPSVLRIFLISDLVSASSIPVLVIGLSDRCWWWRGFEVVVGGLGGILSVFHFGLVYYDGNASMAGKLLILEGGLYAGDWSAFGEFGLIYPCFSRLMCLRRIRGCTVRWTVVGIRGICHSPVHTIRPRQSART